MAQTYRREKRIARHIENLAEPDQKVSARAEGYLIRYYGAEALEQLVEASDHPDMWVRLRAGWAPGYTKDPRAFETILRLTRDPDGYLHYDATIALGILGDDRGIAPLIAFMSVPEEEYSVDSAAAMGLGRMGAIALPAIIDLLDNGETNLRRTASYIAGGIGDERAIEHIARLLGDDDPETRIAGLEGLAYFHTEQALELIDQCVDDPCERVRENAQYWHADLAAELAKATS